MQQNPVDESSARPVWLGGWPSSVAAASCTSPIPSVLTGTMGESRPTVAVSPLPQHTHTWAEADAAQICKT